MRCKAPALRDWESSRKKRQVYQQSQGTVILVNRSVMRVQKKMAPNLTQEFQGKFLHKGPICEEWKGTCLLHLFHRSGDRGLINILHIKRDIYTNQRSWVTYGSKLVLQEAFLSLCYAFLLLSQDSGLVCFLLVLLSSTLFPPLMLGPS
jgi:hypothetical protein